MILFPEPEPAAVFSPCDQYRYVLRRRWADGDNVAAFLMLNPSTADAEKDDPTIRRCIGYAKSWGAAGLLVLNIFAFRATDPRAMKAVADPVGPDNDRTLIELLAGRDVTCAWGVHGSHRTRGSIVYHMLRNAGATLYCLGESKSGQPLHPLMLRKDAERRPYVRGW